MKLQMQICVYKTILDKKKFWNVLLLTRSIYMFKYNGVNLQSLLSFIVCMHSGW